MRLFLVSILFLAPLWVWAQVGTTGSVASQVSISLTPSHPAPQERVVANLDDYRSSSNGAEINWYLDTVFIGTGREVSFVAGEAGSTSELRVVVTKTNGQTEAFTTSVTPVYLDLIIEPLTHVPEFYRGRGLPSAGSQVNVVALLSGTNAARDNLVYDWRVNQTRLYPQPIRGGNTVSFTMPQDSRVTLSLSVTNLAGNVVAKEAVYLLNENPRVYFYEVHSLYGILPTSLTTYSLLSNTLTVRAEPYNLSSAAFNLAEIKQWNLNGEDAISDSNPYEVTLQKTGINGSASLGFRVQSTTNLLQGARGEMNLRF